MILHTIAFAGADDRTDPMDLVSLADEYHEVEIGVLLTKRNGRPAMPSPGWIDRLFRVAPPTMRLCGHICSAWARAICRGQASRDLPNLERFQRLQLNIASPRYLREVRDPEALLTCLRRAGGRDSEQEYIVQVKQGKHTETALGLARSLQDLGANISVLFDSSGGRGVRPTSWPSVPGDLPVGYAGGLGPDTLRQELLRLEKVVGDHSIWIDMQSRVRTDDGIELDLQRVRTCLDIARDFSLSLGHGSEKNSLV